MSGSLRRLAGLVTSPAAKIKRARTLLEEGKGAEGFRTLAPVAQAGNSEAQFLVARCYLEGTGVPPSAQEGARWMEMAANQGYLQAQSTLAALYLRGLPGLSATAAAEGATQATPGAIEGDASDAARHSTTALFVAAEGSRPDFERAMTWAAKAAEAGSADAQALVGFILTSGPEEMRDLPRALEAYRR